MKPDRHPLLRDLLDEAATPAWAEATLARTLAAARARRHRRSLARGAGVLASVALATLLLWSSPKTSQNEMPGHQAAAAPASPPADPSTPGQWIIVDREPEPLEPPSSRPVHFLTDDELLARLPNRSMALIGTGSKQQLIFLDTRDPLRK